jgi:hypothetical protein
MFALLSRSRSKLNKSDVQLPAKTPEAATDAPDASATNPELTASIPEPVVPIVVIEAPLQPPQQDDGRPSASIYSSDERQDAAEDAPGSAADVSSMQPSELSQELEIPRKQPAANQRRFSFRPLSFKFLNGQNVEEHDAKPAVLSTEQEHKKKLQVAEDRTKRIVRGSSADKKAKESAAIVRSLIIGPTGISLPQTKAKAVSKPKAEKVRSQLLKPKSANLVIAQLRALPASNEPLASSNANGEVTLGPAAPIHAVCLRLTDSEAEKEHFSAVAGPKSVYGASVAELTTMFGQMELVNLLTEPNLGLGEPGDQSGLFSGAVPTAKTILDGIEQLTPQLMGLGYATGKVFLPDHAGIHPPTDRVSILTCRSHFRMTALSLADSGDQTGGALRFACRHPHSNISMAYPPSHTPSLTF